MLRLEAGLNSTNWRGAGGRVFFCIHINQNSYISKASFSFPLFWITITSLSLYATLTVRGWVLLSLSGASSWRYLTYHRVGQKNRFPSSTMVSQQTRHATLPLRCNLDYIWNLKLEIPVCHIGAIIPPCRKDLPLLHLFQDQLQWRIARIRQNAGTSARIFEKPFGTRYSHGTWW